MPSRRSRRHSRHRHRKHRTEDAPVTKFESHWSERPARRQIPESEKLLLSFLVALVILLPWAIGTTHFWTQAAAALLAFICLIVALIPNDFGDDPTDTATRRLLQFPFFWLGLLLMGYVTIQGFNPAFRVERVETVVWLNPLEPAAFLPAGIAASIFHQGSFRSLLVLSIPFFAVCALWCGITRRRSAYVLLWVMVLNGLALAGATILQAYTRTKEILWFFPPNPGEPFISSFLHAPHAAAFFLTVIGPALGFGAHYYFQAKRTFERSNPSGLFAFAGIVFTLMLLFSYQPIAAAAAAFLMALLLYFILQREFLSATPLPQKSLFFALGLVVMLVAASMAWNVAEANVERKLSRTASAQPAATEPQTAGEEAPARETTPQEGAEDPDAEITQDPTSAPDTESLETPVGAADREPEIGEFETGWAIFQEYPLYGAGAGSFPYLFHDYRKSPLPEKAESPTRILVGNDWIRLPAEMGLIGSLLVLAAMISLLVKALHIRLLENPIPLFTLLSLTGVLLLAGTRVVFDNPTVLTTWLGLLTASALVIRIETSRVVIQSKSGLSSE